MQAQTETTDSPGQADASNGSGPALLLLLTPLLPLAAAAAVAEDSRPDCLYLQIDTKHKQAQHPVVSISGQDYCRQSTCSHAPNAHMHNILPPSCHHHCHLHHYYSYHTTTPTWPQTLLRSQ